MQALDVFRPFLTGRALAALLAVSLLMPIVWLFGPLVSFGDFRPLETEINRMILCGVLFLLCIVVIWLLERRRLKRDALLVAGIAEADPGADRAAEEEAEMRERLTAALDRLKSSSKKKGGFLYEQPWYVIIGPPGSGKTTALANSGLDFPLSDGGKLQGVGGTRFCEWWLTDQAVLIDTAGRYTTQDSDASADKQGWERFLGLLKKNRPKLPLNGVLVTFGVDMISRLGPAERDAHARTVRRRIKELEEKLGQRLPVYFMVSKSDLLAGFMEFFDDLDKTAREQVWGFTFPADTGGEAGHAAKFGEEFQALLGRVQDRVLERLQQERGPQQRTALAGFPAQFASLESPLGAFVAAAFGGTRLDPAPMLRGVYFTSGTQEGSPLDRLAGALSRSFGLDPRRPAAVMQQKGRAYFITRLLRDVVFNEARLASGDQKAAKRRRIVAATAWGLAALITAGGFGYGYMAWSAEQDRAARLAAQIGKAEQAAQGIPFERVTDAEFRRILPYLDAARDLPPAAQGDGAALGLSQEDKLLAGASAAYRRALDRSFLPRLLARLEIVMRGSFQRPDELYEATRAYLMLGQEGPLDLETVKLWFARDWLRAFPGAVNQPVRDALMGHLDATLARNFHRYPVDGALVDASRRIFSRLPLSDRVFSRLQAAVASQNIAPWRPADAIGAAGQRYFVRASGTALTEGIPGIYTVDGLYRGLLPVLGQTVRQGVAEYWVLGAEGGANVGGDDPVQLEQQVLRLYAQEYARAWQAMLDDLNLAPLPPALAQQAEALNILGAPNSPMKDLLRAIARQLSVGTPPQGWTRPGAQPRPAAAAGQPAAPAEPTGAEPVAEIVEARFEAVRASAGEPVDGVLRIVNDLFVQVQRMATAPPGTLPPPAAGLDPGQRLQAEAARQPQPLQRWMNGMVSATAAARGGGAKAALAAAGAQQLAPFCRGLEQRFPFNINGEDLPVDDFMRLFGPGGVFDQFFTQNVRQYVDITSLPWRPVATDGLPPPISAADLMQFQRARAIREAFFPSVASVGLRFELVPRSMDPGAISAVLEAEGARNEIAQGGSSRPIALSWPARGNTTLTFDPPSLAGPLAYDGAWSALRLVMRRGSTLTATPARERLRLRVVQGERSMDFELRAGSTQHPFGLAELREFRCPTLAP